MGGEWVGVTENECEWVKNEQKWVEVSHSGWECMGVGGSRQEWMGTGESGWEQMEVGGSWWEQVGVSGSGWE